MFGTIPINIAWKTGRKVVESLDLLDFLTKSIIIDFIKIMKYSGMKLNLNGVNL